MQAKSRSTKEKLRVVRWKIREYCEKCESKQWVDCLERDGWETHVCAGCGKQKSFKTT